MKNIFAVAIAALISTAAVAHEKVPLPPKRPASLSAENTTVTLPNGVTVTYPAGAKVDIDQDGRSLDLQIDQPTGSWLNRLLPF